MHDICKYVQHEMDINISFMCGLMIASKVNMLPGHSVRPSSWALSVGTAMVLDFQ